MKTRLHPVVSTKVRRARGLRAFTLVEVLVTMVTVLIVLGGAMATYLYGIKMVQFIQPKLSASDDARKAVAKMTEDIRGAYDVDVGMRTNNTFIEASSFSLHRGNALRIFPSTNTNQFVIYFLDTADKRLKRTADNSTFTDVMASAVSNTTVFTTEDFKGRVLTNDMASYVIGISLQFYQLQYPAVSIGPGNYYESYQLRSKVTRRSF